MSEYTKVKSPYAGVKGYSNPGMIALMETYCAIKGISLSKVRMLQGSFHTGVEASVGTHDKADCLDMNYDDISVSVMRKIGGLAYNRTPAQGFGYHVHMLRMYSTAMAWLATDQDKTYRASGMNGLGNLTHKDTGYMPKYRGVKHLSGPVKGKFKATKITQGYKEAGGQPADHALKKVSCLRPKGWVLNGAVGIVHANGSTYYVTKSLTFYNAANFKTVS